MAFWRRGVGIVNYRKEQVVKSRLIKECCLVRRQYAGRRWLNGGGKKAGAII